MRRALIDKDNLVINVIEIKAGSPWKPSEGHTLLTKEQSEGASPDDTWDGEKFITPEPVDPEPTRLDLLEDRIAALEKPVSS